LEQRCSNESNTNSEFVNFTFLSNLFTENFPVPSGHVSAGHAGERLGLLTVSRRQSPKLIVPFFHVEFHGLLSIQKEDGFYTFEEDENFNRRNTLKYFED